MNEPSTAHAAFPDPLLLDRSTFRAYHRRALSSAWAAVAAYTGGPLMALPFGWLHLRALPVRRRTKLTLICWWSVLVVAFIALCVAAPTWTNVHDGLVILTLHVLTPVPWFAHRSHIANVRRAYVYYGGRYAAGVVFYAIPAIFGAILEIAVIGALS